MSDSMTENDMLKSLLVRIVRSIKRRIRHQKLLRVVREKSESAINSAQKTDHILVLCYGNIYRSPLVEYLLKKSLSNTDIEIRSAGFHDRTGRSCAEEYLKLLAERGYDLAAHRSSRISQDDVNWADLIVIMDRKNWDLLSSMDQQALAKTIWIGAFSPNLSVEVIDPYNQGNEKTRQVISQLEQSVVDIAAKVIEKNQKKSGEMDNGGSE
ncbi:hypothetical protein A3195_18080 [Candidatus Thiodiazotropha endoloripes]|nr:hypothetical protein A3195_18080 [Candidatus Thiodiazotropha endoloripes]